MFLTKESTIYECSICLAPFRDPILLDCGHTFDRQCLQDIINTPLAHHICPICRAPFDSNASFISNRLLTSLIQSKSTTELFLIDVGSHNEQQIALKFLQHLFNQRYKITYVIIPK
jgi:hypothetical protein